MPKLTSTQMTNKLSFLLFSATMFAFAGAFPISGVLILESKAILEKAQQAKFVHRGWLRACVSVTPSAGNTNSPAHNPPPGEWNRQRVPFPPADLSALENSVGFDNSVTLETGPDDVRRVQMA